MKSADAERARLMASCAHAQKNLDKFTQSNQLLEQEIRKLKNNVENGTVKK